MHKVLVLAVVAWLAAGCSSEADKDEMAMGGSGGAAGAAGASGAGGAAGTSSGAGAGGSSTTGSGAGAGGSSAGGSGAGGTGGATGGSGGSGTAPADGSMYAMCSGDADCGDGLNCYENGGYCSTACADDTDCASLGDNFGCSMSGGGFMGGGFMGGGFMGGGMTDGGTAEPTGVCRAVCDGAGDTSCPTGLTCMEGFGGGGGFQVDGGTTGTGRCGYEDMPSGGGTTDGGSPDGGGFPGFPGGFMGGG